MEMHECGFDGHHLRYSAAGYALKTYGLALLQQCPKPTKRKRRMEEWIKANGKRYRRNEGEEKTAERRGKQDRTKTSAALSEGTDCG